MKRSLIQTLILAVLFVAFGSAAVKIQRQGLEKVRANPPFVETWLLSGRSGDLLKLLSLRYDIVTADFLWLRAIQSFGGRGMTNRDWKPVYNMFDTITELDPHFQEAYTFGNLVIGDEAGQQEEGLKLLRKGMFNLLRQYRIPFEGLYVAYWQLSDKKLARWFGRMVTKRKDMPDWVPRIAAYIEVEDGEFYVGFNQFVGNMLQAVDASDPALINIAINKTREVVDKWNRTLLLRALDEYTTRTGKLPAKLQDLASEPALTNYEVPEMSRLLALIQLHAQAVGKDLDKALPEDLLTRVALPDQKVIEAVRPLVKAVPDKKKVANYENEIFRGTLVKRSGIPEDPYGGTYTLNGLQMGNPYGTPNDRIMSTVRLEEELQTVLGGVRQMIGEREKELGRKPADLHEVFRTDFKTTEPFGGEWRYSPETGDFRSSSRPSL